MARHPIADKDTTIHNWVAGIASQYNRSSGIRRHRRRGSSSCKGRRNDNVTLGHCAYIAIRTSNRHLIRDIRSWQQSVPLVDIVAGTVATGARAYVHGSDDHSGNKGGADHDSACVPRRRMTPPPMVQLAQHRSPPPDRPRGRPPAMIPLPLALRRGGGGARWPWVGTIDDQQPRGHTYIDARTPQKVHAASAHPAGSGCTRRRTSVEWPGRPRQDRSFRVVRVHIPYGRTRYSPAVPGEFGILGQAGVIAGGGETRHETVAQVVLGIHSGVDLQHARLPVRRSSTGR